MLRYRAFVVAAVIVLSSCTHVHPYERGRLAHPTMTTVGEPSAAADHMHAVHEGAAGGAAGVESGCGCN